MRNIHAETIDISKGFLCRCLFVTLSADSYPRRMRFIDYTIVRNVFAHEDFVIGGETGGVF